MPGNIYTQQTKKLGTVNFLAGTTAGMKLDNEAIIALGFLIKSSGTAVATIDEIISALKRVIVNINGQDDFNLSGQALYLLNRQFLGGAESPTDASATNRYLYLELDFSMPGGIGSDDSLLDLRQRPGGSLPQAYVQFDLSTIADVGIASEISVYQKYYELVNYERNVATRKVYREKQINVTAGGAFQIPLEYQDGFDDIFHMMFVESSGTLQNDPLDSVNLVMNGNREIFNIDNGKDPLGLTFIPKGLQPRPAGFVDDYDSVFMYDYRRSNLLGSQRRVTGALDNSEATSMVLQGQSNVAGVLHLLQARVSVETAPKDIYKS